VNGTIYHVFRIIYVVFLKKNVIDECKSKHMRCLLFSLMLLFAVGAKAIKVTHGPWICDMDSTGTTIVWVTDVPGMSWVEIAPDSADHFYGRARQRYYDVLAGRKVLTDSVHRVRIEGLKPDTKYRYRVFTQEVAEWRYDDWVTLGKTACTDVWRGKPHEFKTFPAKPREVTFLVLNDIHERAQFMKDLCKNVDFKKLDFVLLNGDMSNRLRNQQHMMEAYLDTCVRMFATHTPLFFNRGNHELRGQFADYLYRYFPTNNGKYYRVQHVAGIDFLFIDTGEDKPDEDIEYSGIVNYDQYREEEARWLRGLRESKQVGKHPLIVFSHIPPTLQKWHGPYHLQKTLMPELNKMNVSVMLSAHLHAFGYQEPNEVINFPNLVNSNNTYLLCRIANGKMEVDYVGLKGKDKKHFTFPLK
jgi:putative purple acid phosphatase